MMRIEIIGRGHRNITARHKTTLEITKDEDLGPEGDCIVAVGADKGFRELGEELKDAIRRSNVRVTLVCGEYEWSMSGRGTPNLSMENPHEMVLRKSGYECGRTLIVGADKAACDIPRNMVKCLKDPGNEVRMVIETIG